MIDTDFHALVPIAQVENSPLVEPGETGPEQNPLFGFMVPLALIMVMMYLLTIRPQNLKMKKHKEMLTRLKVGDEIVTSGGIFATVAKVDEAYLDVEVAQNVVLTISRAAVARLKNEDAL